MMMNRHFTVVGLDDESLPAYCRCLEEWSEEMAEAGDLKRDWTGFMKDRGLGVRMARSDKGEFVGMVQYYPAEYSPVDAPGHYHIHCCWVHAYRKKGVGDWRGRGVGTALLAAAEEDILSRGAAGITAWGLTIPVWMRASWYRRHDYRKAASDGVMALMWKPLADDARPPVWRHPDPELKVKSPGAALSIRSLAGGVCPAVNVGQERVRKIVGEYGERIDFRRITIRTPEDVERWGVCDGLYIDGRAVSLGPPPSEAKLRRIVDRGLRSVRRRSRR